MVKGIPPFSPNQKPRKTKNKKHPPVVPRPFSPSRRLSGKKKQPTPTHQLRRNVLGEGHHFELKGGTPHREGGVGYQTGNTEGMGIPRKYTKEEELREEKQEKRGGGRGRKEKTRREATISVARCSSTPLFLALQKFGQAAKSTIIQRREGRLPSKLLSHPSPPSRRPGFYPGSTEPIGEKRRSHSQAEKLNFQTGAFLGVSSHIYQAILRTGSRPRATQRPSVAPRPLLAPPSFFAQNPKSALLAGKRRASRGKSERPSLFKKREQKISYVSLPPPFLSCLAGLQPLSESNGSLEEKKRDTFRWGRDGRRNGRGRPRRVLVFSPGG
jgi:hypothetical protein